jgi:hypothetical protein
VTHRSRPAAGTLTLSQALLHEGSDKTTVHNYGAFYDGLVETLRPSPSFGGRSIPRGVPEGMATRRLSGGGNRGGPERGPGSAGGGRDCADFSPVLRQLSGQQFDLIIDDGSHQLQHQQAAVTQLWPLLRSGERVRGGGHPERTGRLRIREGGRLDV